MKAKINSYGRLRLMRKGQWKEQFCPHNRDIVCGDWCPLFEEPEGYLKQDDDDKPPIPQIWLALCNTTLFFDKADFVDERE
jgi:hypothetical protein